MGCIQAPACRAALDEATRLWPNRNKASDGICASATHSSQNSSSDHEQGNAFDLTHDPANGVDAHALVQAIIDRRDPRVKYVISQGRIWNPSISQHWRPYNGSNRHDKHTHISIKASARPDTSAWFIQEEDEVTEADIAKIKALIDNRTGDIYNLLIAEEGDLMKRIKGRTGETTNIILARLDKIDAELAAIKNQ